MLGCSLIINHTQIGPIMVSNKKNKFTSAAGINLGAIVTNTNGMATQRIHIKGTIYRSLSTNKKLSMKNNAKVATNNLPTTAAGTKFFDLADRIVTAPTARPTAVMKPSISPKKLPNFRESKKIYIIAKKVIIIEIHVFLSGGSFKNIAPSIADNIGAVAIITSVLATLVF